MTFTVELSHIIAALTVLFTSAGVAANWLLRDQRRDIKEIRDDLKKLRDIDLPLLLSNAKADMVERIGKSEKDCTEKVISSIARLEERHHALVENMHQKVNHLQSGITDLKTDHGPRLRAAERILGRYEVLNHGRTGDES